MLLKLLLTPEIPLDQSEFGRNKTGINPQFAEANQINLGAGESRENQRDLERAYDIPNHERLDPNRKGKSLPFEQKEERKYREFRI